MATAGHIDHGKSTLIEALTGIDPDRLEEEKRRGMTIDLGFAHLALPSGRLLGIVDVPGHARFIRNMLAGVNGIDAVLLVVAADEGVMPQTVEHLEIVQLLDVRRGVVALTKTDLVEPDLAALAADEVRERLAGTTLAGAELVPVSALTGAGLGELKAALDRVLGEAGARPDLGRPRLPIDRVFTIGGFGTVVTGTLVEGPLAVGEELEVVPGRKRVRVRGLEQHNRRLERVTPGGRVAVNLVGAGREELDRGQVLARPGTLAESRRVDAEVAVLPAAARPLRHGAALTLHAGTAEVRARAILLEGDEIPAGGRGWVQLYLAEPLAARPGDRFVLRRPSPPETLAGGRFVDLAPRRHHRGDPRLASALERRLAGGALAEELAKHPLGITAQALGEAAGQPGSNLDGVEARRAGDWVFTPAAWSAIAGRAAELAAAHHRAQPLRPGLPREELRSRLGLAPAAFAAVLPELVKEGAVVERQGAIALPGHEVSLDGAAGPGRALVQVLGREPFAPPSVPDALREAGAGPEVLAALARAGEVVRLSEEVAFTRAAYEQALARMREIVAAEGGVTVARLRDALGASRRPVLALLEHLDAERVTRRSGDVRTLR